MSCLEGGIDLGRFEHHKQSCLLLHRESVRFIVGLATAHSCHSFVSVVPYMVVIQGSYQSISGDI